MSIQIVMMLPPRAASVSFARHALGEALSIPGVSPDCIPVSYTHLTLPTILLV